MEILETIGWIALGFIPTLLSLEFFSKYHSRLRRTYSVDRLAGIKGVRA